MRLAPGAWRLAALPLVAAVPVALVSPLLGVASVVVGCAVLAFFRDPERTPPETGILAPADGRVSVLRVEDDRVRVGVFMNVWNVHVARAPATGTVRTVAHRPGAHRPAFSKDSDRNERVRVELERSAGHPIEVTLIAGAFARRIHPYPSVGEELERGERLGHIAFGSRVDVLLPPGVGLEDIAIDRRQRVRAGETVLV